MKIIDLLNKIANGEEVPKKIKYLNRIYEYSEQIRDYEDDDYSYESLYDKYLTARMFKNGNTEDMLNSKLEIIEEDNKDKKINRLEILDWEAFKIMTAGDKYELYKNIITIMNVFIDCINNSFEDNDLINKIKSLENKQ